MKIKKILKSIWNELIYGGHLQPLGAASIIFVSGILLKIQITWDVLFVTYILFYPLFLYNRFKEIKIDYLTNSQRTQHIKKYIKFIPIILYLVIFILVISLIYFSNFRALIFGLLVLFFGFLYTIIFKKFTNKIPLFKDLYVAAVFALLPFFLLVYYSYFLVSINVLLLSLLIFLESFLMPVFLDIKDIESDKREKLRTLPVMLGKEKTIVFLSIFNLIGTMTIMAFIFYLSTLPKSILMLLFTIPFDFYCYMLVKRRRRFGYILQGGKFILWPFLVLLGKIILC